MCLPHCFSYAILSILSFFHPCTFLLQLFPVHPNSAHVHEKCVTGWWHEHSFINRSGCKLVLSYCTTKSCMPEEPLLSAVLPHTSNFLLSTNSCSSFPAGSPLHSTISNLSAPIYSFSLFIRKGVCHSFIFPQPVKLFSCITGMTSPVGATLEQRGVTLMQRRARAPSPF